jgi:hypothetical protein
VLLSKEVTTGKGGGYQRQADLETLTFSVCAFAAITGVWLLVAFLARSGKNRLAASPGAADG